jgi:U3 small nucleolar RNA-associated protein 4
MARAADTKMASVAENGKKRKPSAAGDATGPLAVDAPTSTTAAPTALRVHRCRFIDWMPEAVDALCFSPAGDELAVARANGDVEVWHIVARKWHLRFVVSGSSQSKISALVWTPRGRRLFVASLDGTLWEVDFATLRKKNVVDSNGGPIWCVAVNHETQSLAVGCEDGRIRVFSFAQDDDIVFARGFVTTGSRVVSLAWHAASNKLFSGSEDGVIHCWHGASGRNDARITLETLANQKCVVWSLVVLDDLTVVSGDSHGHLSFWNGHTHTLQQKFSHLTADILALAIDASNTMLFASGVDNQVAEYRRVSSSWAYAYSHRAHSHDVRALALSSARRPLLVSGGIDTQLVWYNAASFNVQRPFKIASMPRSKTVSLSRETRVLLVQKSTSLDLWRLASGASHQRLVEIQMRGTHNIACSALAPNGAFVACSTAQELKLFRLDTAAGFVPRKLALPHALGKDAARVVAFSPDSTRLVVASASETISVVDLTRLEVLKTFHTASNRPAVSSAEDTDDSDAATAPILSLSVSLDGQWLAVGDAANYLSVYNLDSMQFYCHLPRPQEMHTSIGFNPSGKILVVTLVSNSFVCYDVEKKGLSDWYREHHERFPKAITDGRNIKGMAFDPAAPELLYLYSQSSLYQIDMSDRRDSPKPPVKKRRTLSIGGGNDSDAKATTDDGDDAVLDLEDGLCRVINRYRPLSFVDFVDGHELLVVETPWLKVLSRLPGALQRHKYGK